MTESDSEFRMAANGTGSATGGRAGSRVPRDACSTQVCVRPHTLPGEGWCPSREHKSKAQRTCTSWHTIFRYHAYYPTSRQKKNPASEQDSVQSECPLHAYSRRIFDQCLYAPSDYDSSTNSLNSLSSICRLWRRLSSSKRRRRQSEVGP